MKTLYFLALLLSVNTDYYYVQGDVGVSHLSAKSAQTVNDVSGRTSVLMGIQKKSVSLCCRLYLFWQCRTKSIWHKNSC